MTKARIILLAGLLVLAGLAGMAGCRSAHTTSAILYIDEQNYEKAVAVIHEGFQYRDDEPDAYYYLGEAYSHLAEEAIEKEQKRREREERRASERAERETEEAEEAAEAPPAEAPPAEAPVEAPPGEESFD